MHVELLLAVGDGKASPASVVSKPGLTGNQFMKQATVTIKLSKDQDVVRENVTPIEALLLTAEHHRNVGGSPIEVHKDTIKDVGREEEYEHVVTPAIAAQPAANGKPAVEAVPAKVEKRKRWVKVEWSVDQECARLRGRYHGSKVDAILTKVRDIPTDDFEKAVQLGVTVVFPTNKLAEAKII